MTQDFTKTTEALRSALSNKKVRRNARRRIYADILTYLETTPFSKGVPGFCFGARPAQVRAAAKQMAINESAAAMRKLRAA